MFRQAASLAVVLACVTTVAVSQVHTPRPVEVVNLPLVQPVTSEELRALQELQALLLVRMTGAVPEGFETVEIEVCEVTGLTDFYETASHGVGEAGCSPETYTRACAIAAANHRLTCRETCAGFEVIGARRACHGEDRPVIAPFSSARCAVDAAGLPVVHCVVTGWCNCDP